MLGLNLQKDGVLYSLASRLLLPDETS